LRAGWNCWRAGKVARAGKGWHIGGRYLIKSAEGRASPQILTNTGATANHNKTDIADKVDISHKTDPPMLNRADCICMYPK
jgi:hypothetical protein